MNGISSSCYNYNDNLFTRVQLERDDEVYRQKYDILSWPVVHLYRSLIIAAIKTFFVNPIYRTLMFLLLFFIFVLHDRSAKPFKNKNMNILHSSCTICLTFIVMCNLLFAFTLYLPKIYTIDGIDTVLKLLSYIENIMYFIPPLVLPVTIVWRKYILKLKDESTLSHHWCYLQ